MVADDDDSLSPELHTVVRPEFSRPALQVLVYARCVDLEEIAEDWDASGCGRSSIRRIPLLGRN
jgi:hypothetical protein